MEDRAVRYYKFKVFFILSSLCFVFAVKSDAQKKQLDDTAFDSWQTLGDYGISNDGRFAYYYVRNEPKGKSTLVVSKTNGDVVNRFIGAHRPVFTDRGGRLCFMIGNDTVCLLDLY